ncbi:MAG: alpha/beta hydrolase [Verrucomicrobia bacterium]|nr:alpha/beta hydrolase [Verrucomicrobiota bacterium]
MEPAVPTPRLHRSIAGSGPIVLLLHGVTRCGADWDPLNHALTSHARVIALDQRGHGASPRADRYLVTDYVADTVRFISEEVDGPLMLFGHSLGAMVSAAVAAARPDLVRGIVLEDPPFHTMGNRIGGSAWEAQFIGMRGIARQGGSHEAMTDALSALRIPMAGGGFRTLGELRDRASLGWSARCLGRMDPEVLTPVIEGRWLDGYDLAGTLSGIRCPVLLLQGDPSAGGALTDEDAAAIESAVARCSRLPFPGCGHQIHRDRPEEVWQAWQNFTRP